MNIHHIANKLLHGCSQDTSERLVDILHQVLTDPEATTTFLTRTHSSADTLQSFKTDLQIVFKALAMLIHGEDTGAS